MRARIAVLVALVARALAVASASCASQRPEPVSTTAADHDGSGALPRATLTTLRGDPAELAQVAQGRVALVSFWATWCEACLKEMDALNRLAERTAGRSDALVVGVAVGESPANVEAFVRRRGLGYVQLVDEEFRLADALGQRRVPATLVLDRTGRVVHRGDALDSDSLEAFRKTLGDVR
jgi:thiol-disulfide isomerase/thioredoxin